MRFQSTLPIQGATLKTHSWRTIQEYFNPRSLYRERRCVFPVPLGPHIFQSTLPIQGATDMDHSRNGQRIDFNPRSLYRERLYPDPDFEYIEEISIHAPYTGSDNYNHC